MDARTAIQNTLLPHLEKLAKTSPLLARCMPAELLKQQQVQEEDKEAAPAESPAAPRGTEAEDQDEGNELDVIPGQGPLHLETLGQFKQVVKDAGELLLIVDFWAEWCGPCKIIGPVVEQLAKEPDFVIAKVDVDDNAATSDFAGIRAMPTFQFYKGGELIDEFSGGSEETLRAKIDEHK